MQRRIFSSKQRAGWLVAITTILWIGGFSATSTPVHGEDHWPGWRGPHANGHWLDKDLPTEWDDDSIVWKSELPGSGQSSPIVWGNRIFLSSARNGGRERIVFCLDRSNGEILWQQTAWRGEPEPVHNMTGWASATCVTDGERVYAFFGKGGLHCYTVDGEAVWSVDLGEFAGPWGTGASPVLVRDLVIQNCDADENARIVGLDKKTGEIVWDTERPEFRGWSTPVLIQTDDREELVMNGHLGVHAYDPDTGAELWFCKGFNGRGEPTATYANGLLHIVNGRAGDVFTVRPGGSGDVTMSHRAWQTPRRRGRDLPSPIVIGEYMLVMNMQGVLTAYHSLTGEELWLGRIGGTFSASPIASAGLAYFISESGEVVVIDPGDELNIVARNKLTASDDEVFRSTITPHGGELLIRSDRTLFCVGRN